MPRIKVYLAKPDKTIIGRIDRNIISPILTTKSKETNTFGFSIPYNVTDRHALTVNKYFDLIKPHYLLKIDYNRSTTWFKIQNITKSSKDKETLNATAYSLEIELNGKKVVNLNETSINAEKAIVLALSSSAIDDTAEGLTSTTSIVMANHNLSVNDYIENTTLGFIRKVNEVTDVNTIVVDAIVGQTSGNAIVKYKNATNWTISTVEDSFKTTYRNFESNFDSALSFIQEIIAETFDSIAIFDTENRTISLLPESSVGSNKGLTIRPHQYMLGMDQESNSQQVSTRLYCWGENNLPITRVNPTGREYIDNFDYFKSTDYMTQELITALNTYDSLLLTKQPISDVAESGTSTTTLNLNSHGLSVGHYIVNSTRSCATRVVLTTPNANSLTVASIENQAEGDTILKYNSSTFGYLLFEKEDLQAELVIQENELSVLKNEKSIILDTLSTQTSAATLLSYSGSITSTTITKTLSGLNAGDKYVAIVRIEATTGTTVTLNGVGKSFTSDVWTVIGKMTGSTSYVTEVVTSGTNIDVRIMMLKITGSEYSTALNENLIIDKYSDNNKQIEIDVKQAEIDVINANITSKDADIAALQSELSYEENLTSDQLSKLKIYIFEDEFRDENIADDYDLISLGVAEQAKTSIPQILYKIDIVDFESCLTEARNVRKLNNNDIITTIHPRLNINIESKILEIERDFQSKSVSIVIGSSKDILSNDDKFINAIKKSITTTNSFTYKKSGYSTTKTNFDSRNDRISTVPSDPTVASDGSAIDHVVNDNGTVDISFEWSFSGSGNSYSIDGFIVYVYPSSTDNVYAFGSTVANDEFNIVPLDKRSYILQGVPSNKYYTFGIQAYRRVDADISSDGIIKSNIVQSSVVAENPYRPESNVAFLGDITGTIGGIPYDEISKTAATFIVADGSTSLNVNRADFVVPVGSESSQDVINTAISALGSSGGEIVLLDGTYTVDDSIIHESNVSIKGQGNSTILKVKDNLNSSISVFKNSDTIGGNTNLNISNMGIDGNEANNSSGTHWGIDFFRVSFSALQNLKIFNFRDIGISLQLSDNNTLTGSLSQGNAIYGVYIKSSNNNTINGNVFNSNDIIGLYIDTSDGNSIAGNTSQDNGVYGMGFIFSDKNALVGNTFSDNGTYGMFIFSSDRNTITGNTSSENGNDGMYLEQSESNAISGNTLQGNGSYGVRLVDSIHNSITNNICKDNSQTTNNTYDNIMLSSSSFNNIQNNICRAGSLTNKPRYGVNISTSTCTSNIISNNDLSNGGVSGNFSDSGTDSNSGLNASTGNRDYVTTGTAQAGGAATITLKTTSSAVNSVYNGFTIFITSGTGSGQNRIISGYVGSTKVATVSVAWGTNPDNTSVYETR